MSSNSTVAERSKKKALELVGFREKKAAGMPTDGLFVVVGAVKTGKSEFVSSFPDSYILACEKGGMDHIAGRIDNIDNMTDFREKLMAVINEPSIKVIGIDTIDAVGEWIGQDVAKDFGLDHMGEKKKGVDGYALWGEYGNRMKNLITVLMDCGKLVVLTAHYKAAEVDINGEKVNSAKLAIPGSAADFLSYHAKMIGNTYKEDDGQKTNYYLSFRGGPLGHWGSRVREVQDKTIVLPEENGYEAFAALFENADKPRGGK